jgi:4-hydroxybenzoate polyprenyltransferase
MKTKSLAFFKLVQIQQSLPVLLFSTLLGAASTKSDLRLSLVYVLFANLMVSCFFSILRNLQFAPVDMSDPKNRVKNPIAAGTFSVKASQTMGGVLVILAIVLYSLAGNEILITGLGIILITFILSWRKLGLHRIVLLKTNPQHWLLNSLFCLLGGLSLQIPPNPELFLAVAFIGTSLIYTTLIDYTRLTYPQKPQRRVTIGLIASLTIAILIGITLFILLAILPVWILILFGLLLAIMLLPKMAEQIRQGQRLSFEPKILRTALFRAASLCLLIHFLAPYLFKLFNG